MKKMWIIGMGLLCLTACTTPKQMTLFAGKSESSLAPLVPVYVIDPGDVLQVEFSTITGEGAQPYNSAGTSYVVRNDSTITMPVLGRIRVAGMTTTELVNDLEKRVMGQIKQPIVRVEITNATISILGEVERPATIDAKHPIRLVEALSIVGGPTKYARLDNVLVQRNEGGMVKSYRINMTKDDLTHSPCYYLHKGDVLYIAPRLAK